jgi:hypothetical protein
MIADVTCSLSSCSVGLPPASELWLALTRIMNRMALLPRPSVHPGVVRAPIVSMETVRRLAARPRRSGIGKCGVGTQQSEEFVEARRDLSG